MHTFYSTRPWQLVAGAVTAAVLIAGNPLSHLPAAAAPAAIKRISGDTRLATAARVAEESFPSGSEWAVLSSADDWHATLGAAPLAGQLNAAQLLTWPDRLDETAKALERLGVKRIVIVGSISKVSGAVENQLRQKYQVERIAPSNLGEGNQYELARLLTARTIVAAGGSVDNTEGAIPPTIPSPTPVPGSTSTPSAKPTATAKPTARPGGKDATGETGQPTVAPDSQVENDALGTPNAVEALPTADVANSEPQAVEPTTGEPVADTSQVRSRPSVPKFQVPANFAVISGKRTVFVASGKAFPDALAASAIAYKTSVPMLFVDGPGQPVPQHTALALKAYAPEQIVVLGGTSAISAATANQLSAQSGGARVHRLSGSDRVATSVAVADWSVKQVGFDPDSVSIARSDAFPDAVTAGQYAASHKSPIVLSTAPKYLTDVPVRFVLNNCKAVNKIVGFGGRAALDDTVLKAFSQAGGCVKPSKLPQVAPGGATPKPPTPTPTKAPTPTPTVTPTQNPGNSGTTDAMKRLAKTKWKIHPEINRKVNTNASGMQDKISTLSVLALHGTSDGSKLPRQINWGLLACNKVRLDGAGVPIFSDTNNDGYADGLNHSSNEGIDITGINSRNVANGKLLLNQPVTSGLTNAILTSGIDDCAWVAAFDPADNNKIKINKEGRAITPLGLGWLRIGNGPRPGEQTGREVNTKHIYSVSPDDSTKRANEGVELKVTRKDGKPVNKRLSIVAMPCKSVTVGQGDVLVKPMPNDSRAGLGYGSTDNNRATVTHFMGKPEAKPRRIYTGSPQNGQFKFTVNATGADCGAFMVIEGNGNGKLDLDAAKRPTEPFGVANVRWTK